MIGKFIATEAYFKKQEKYQINNLTLQLAKRTKKEQASKDQSKEKEGNNKYQSRNKKHKDRKNPEKINETKSWFFEKINKIDKTLS